MKPIIKNVAEQINETNEKVFVLAIRQYYKNNFRNGISDESFLLWIEQIIENKGGHHE